MKRLLIVHAVVVELSLVDSVVDQSSFQVSSGGVTGLFFDANLSRLFDSDSDGIAIPDIDRPVSAFTVISSFSLSFDTRVQADSYNIGFFAELEGDENFTITSSSGTTLESAIRERSQVVRHSHHRRGRENSTFVASGGSTGRDLIRLCSITVTVLPAAVPEGLHPRDDRHRRPGGPRLRVECRRASVA